MVSKLPKGEGSAAWLLDYLLGQTLEGYERSIKLTMGEVLDRRYLGGVAFNRVQRKGVLEICRRLDIPRPLVDLMSAEAEDAIAVIQTGNGLEVDAADRWYGRQERGSITPGE